MTQSQGDIDAALASLQTVRSEVGRAVLGQQEVIDQLLIALMADGHVLHEGAPGLGKTLLVRSLAQCVRKKKTNVLVLGALSRNVVERAIVGSTAEKILYDTPCDVLIMKSTLPRE